MDPTFRFVVFLVVNVVVAIAFRLILLVGNGFATKGKRTFLVFSRASDTLILSVAFYKPGGSVMHFQMSIFLHFENVELSVTQRLIWKKKSRL